MLRITNLTGNVAKTAKTYYAKEDNYYAKDATTEWQGVLAKELNLSGEVNAKIFEKFLSGKFESGKDILKNSRVENSKKRMGMDFTFSAPKSISIQGLVGDDKEIIHAHDKAVKIALQELEKYVFTRKREDANRFLVNSANFLVAKFRHELSRELDPQIHTHAIVMNFTKRDDDKYTAIANENLFKITKQIDAIYKNELLKNILEIGYDVRFIDTNSNFELAHINDEQIKAFSKRSEIIKNASQEIKGKNYQDLTKEEQRTIAKNSRKYKEKVDHTELLQEWLMQANEHNINLKIQKNTEKTKNLDNKKSNQDANNIINLENNEHQKNISNKIIEHSVNHLLEKQIAVSKQDLIAEAIKKSYGKISHLDVINTIEEFIKDKKIIQSEQLYCEEIYKYSNSSINIKTKKQFIDEIINEKLVKIEDAEKQFNDYINSKKIIKKDILLTNKKAIEIEKNILTIEKEGRNIINSLINKDLLNANKEQISELTKVLNDEQKNAIDKILNTKNRCIFIQGDAGVGKSFTLKVLDDVIKNINNQSLKNIKKDDLLMINKYKNEQEKIQNFLKKEANKTSKEYIFNMKKQIELKQKIDELDKKNIQYDIKFLAPYNEQVASLKQDELNANTLQSFLNDKKRQINSNSIIILDEAGIVSSKQMLNLMQIVEKNEAKLILLGDTKQTQAIQAGKPLQILKENGIETINISEIQRQKNIELKSIVKDIASNEIEKSFNKLMHYDNIEIIKKDEDRYKKIANDYAMDFINNKNTILVVGENSTRDAINKLIRHQLGFDNSNKKATIDILKNIDITEEDIKNIYSYSENSILKIKNELFEIKKVNYESNSIIINKLNDDKKIQKEDEKKINIEFLRNNFVQIFKQKKIDIVENELIKFTQNIKSKDINNNDEYIIKSISNDNLVTLESKKNKKTIQLNTNELKYIDYGYTKTVHASQGLTADKTILELDYRSPTTSKNVYYVGVSRAKHHVKIYTNDFDKTRNAIQKEIIKTTTLNVVDFRNEKNANKEELNKNMQVHQKNHSL